VQDGSEFTNDPPGFAINKKNIIEVSIIRLSLPLPVPPAVICMQNRPALADRPAIVRVQKKKIMDILLYTAWLHSPGFSSVSCMNNCSLDAGSPALLRVNKRYTAQQFLSDAAVLLFPCLPAIGTAQYSPVITAHPDMLRTNPGNAMQIFSRDKIESRHLYPGTVKSVTTENHDQHSRYKNQIYLSPCHYDNLQQ
jgi:hypothetical protein